MIYDNLPDVKLYVIGSSSIDLANSISETLTGRKWENYLYPLSYKELSDHFGILNENRNLEERLIYGSYPDLINANYQKERTLTELADSYLYKDILQWAKIKKSNKLERLLQLLAFQIGNEVSYSEMSNTLDLDISTVQSYIDLLEKSYVIFSLASFSKNLRNEIKKSRKVFFYDLGIRNALIKQWSPIALRDDVGKLWENYLIAERKKQNEYKQNLVNMYFWRTHSQQEIDLIEERDGKLNAFELKWSKKDKMSFPKSFLKAYPDSNITLINRNNYEEFIS